MALSRERMGFLPALDQFLPKTRPQESITTEAEVRQKLHEAIQKDLMIMAATKALEQDPEIAGFALPQFKVGKRSYNAFMERGSSGFTVSDIQWKDDPQTDDEVSPLHQIKFIPGEPSVHSMQQESLEAKYSRIARTTDRIRPANMLTRDLKPSSISLADLQVVTNDINQARIEHQANTMQSVLEQPQAA